MSRIVFVGEACPGSRTLQRLTALRDLGHAVVFIPTTPPGRRFEDPPTLAARLRYRLRLPADETDANQAFLAAAPDADIAILDNARAVTSSTLRQARQRAPRLRFVWYAEDDMMNPTHLSRWTAAALPLFSLWVTTKSYNLDPHEMPSRGVRQMMFVNNAYDRALHRPQIIDAAAREAFGASVSFVGTYEHERARSLLRLAELSIAIRVWGNGWRGMINRHPKLRVESQPVYDDDYARVIAASDINLCYLRRLNRDRQTTRSIEIPACGGFMIHERNTEIGALFTEDLEAAYFSDTDELARQCRRWLDDPAGRASVAVAARRKVEAIGLSHHEIMGQIVRRALEASP